MKLFPVQGPQRAAWRRRRGCGAVDEIGRLLFLWRRREHICWRVLLICHWQGGCLGRRTITRRWTTSLRSTGSLIVLC